MADYFYYMCPDTTACVHSVWYVCLIFLILLRYCLDQITSGIMLIVVYVCVSRQEAATAYNKGLALAASNR